MSPSTMSEDEKPKAEAEAEAKAKRVTKGNTYWYILCDTYSKGNYKSQVDFLRSDASGRETSTKIFSRMLQKYKRGDLVPDGRMRKKTPEFLQIEQRLVRYISANEGDHEALAWANLRMKAMEIAKVLGYPKGSFRASSGWLHRVLKRNEIILGKESPISNEEARESIAKLKKYLKQNDMPKESLAKLNAIDRQIQSNARKEAMDPDDSTMAQSQVNETSETFAQSNASRQQQLVTETGHFDQLTFFA